MPEQKSDAQKVADEIMNLAADVVEKTMDAPEETFVVKDAPLLTPEGKMDESVLKEKLKRERPKKEATPSVEIREVRPQAPKRLSEKTRLELEAGKKAIASVSPTEAEIARGKDAIEAYKK